MQTTFKTIEELPMTLSVINIANALGLSRSCAYALMKSEGFPSIRIGKRLITPKVAFEGWMEQSLGKKVVV